MHPGNLLQILPVISPAKKIDLFRISKELGFPVVKNPPANTGDSKDAVWSLGREDPLEEKMPTHWSILAWKIPWTKPGGLQSIGSQRVRYNRVYVRALTHTHTHTAKNYNSRSATMVSHLQVLHRNGENDSFIEGVKKAERAIGSQRVAFHWLNCDWPSWLNSYPERKWNLFSFLFGLCYHHGLWELPFVASWLYFNWGFQ